MNKSKSRKSKILLISSLISCGFANMLYAQAPTIASTSPSPNALNVSIDSPISVTFDQSMGDATSDNFVIQSNNAGKLLGTYSSVGSTISFTPTNPFMAVDKIRITLTADVQSATGTALSQPFGWEFTTEAKGKGSGVFPTQELNAVGNGPSFIAAADLDKDGDVDLVTTNLFDNNISVLFNDGNGGYAFQSTYAVGLLPRSVIAADLDGDGDIDLVTANPGSSNISVLFNAGNGTFASEVTYDVDGIARFVVAADLDGDGDVDLLTANNYGNNLSVFVNNGSGDFTAQVTSYVSHPHYLVVADLDLDGDLDLVISNNDANSISVLTNNGQGDFGGIVIYDVGNEPTSIAAADLDGDGDIDLVVSLIETPNSVSVMLNDGGGNYADQVLYGAGWASSQLVVADFDHDGDFDIATADEEVDEIFILLNSGNGTFANAVSYTIGDRPWSIFAADLDGDGDADLAVANFQSDNVSVLLNQSSGLGFDQSATTPQEFTLYQNFPNPFNPESTIRFDLSEATVTSLAIYDLNGRQVTQLLDMILTAGYHKVVWNSTDDAGQAVPSGLYIARLVTPGYTKSIKMVLMK